MSTRQISNLVEGALKHFENVVRKSILAYAVPHVARSEERRSVGGGGVCILCILRTTTHDLLRASERPKWKGGAPVHKQRAS